MQDELNHGGRSLRDDPQELARIVALSDGVFAIALTLLVLTLDVPDLEDVPKRLLDEELRRGLLDQAPRIGTFCLSFAVEATYWLSHHVKFRVINRYDHGLIWINFLFLLLISFLPFPTEVLGRYGDEPVALAFYGGSLAATGFAATLLWWYASHGHRLIDKRVPPEMIRRGTLRNVAVPTVFLMSALAAFVSVGVARALAYLALPLGVAIMRWQRRDRAALEAVMARADGDHRR